jgi:serine/threonine protein kinase
MTDTRTVIAGRYLLQEPLGQGGMGRVWLSQDTKLNREVAVKEVVAPEGFTEADLRELRPRALREARAAARLNHPNVVRVYDIVVVDSSPWIVMEYIPSRSLVELGPISPAQAATVGLGVVSALAAAHQVGVLHRDVKPANVLIDHNGRTVLTDFGLATIVGDPSVTRSGVIIGSPSFMAPERAADQAPGAAADLWSLGATLYFAVEGRSPYARPTTLATLAALASEDVPYAPHAGALWPVLEGLLRRDPADRLDAATAERMLRDIARPAGLLAPAPAAPPKPRQAPPRTAPPLPTAPPASPAPLPAADTASVPSRGRRPRWLVLAAALVLLVALAAWLIPRFGGSDPTSQPTNTPTNPPAATTPPPATPGPTATGGSTEGPAPPTALALPPGWHLHRDPTGFTVAVPASWTISRRGTIVYFDEPNGGRLLGIDQTKQPQPDPVADWTGKERYRVARGDFPNYERVRLEAVDYFTKAADWEFKYTRDGVRLHVNNRGFITSPTQAYGMWWSTPDSQWAASVNDLALIQRSFTPA